MAPFQRTLHDIRFQRALNVKAVFDKKIDNGEARQDDTRKTDIRRRFDSTRRKSVCTHPGFMLGADGLRE